MPRRCKSTVRPARWDDAGIALGRSCVAIVPAKFFLKLYRAHRGIYLNLFVKTIVISLRDILHKVAGPGTAVAARRIKARIKAQRLTCDDGLQRSAGLQRFQFVIVLNARQLQPINFCVLRQKGFVRGAEHGIPPKSNAAGEAGDDGRMCAATVAVSRKERAAQASQQREKNQFTL